MTIKRTLVACGALICLAVVGFFTLFAGYGISQGFSVIAGLKNLISVNPAPVAANPSMRVLKGTSVTWLADIKDYDLNESSGLTTSQMHPGVFWSINDSGHHAELFALGSDGATIARFDVDLPQPVDWEAMDSYTSDGSSYLVIGDTGDNLRWRPSVSIHIVPEPTRLIEVADAERLNVARTIVFSYPDGPRDSEALAVDRKRNRILILSKRHYPPELFSVPLDASGETEVELVSVLNGFPRPTADSYYESPKNGRYRFMPSGMDVLGDRLLVVTYKPALMFDLTNLDRAPLLIPLPRLGQREAISFGHNDPSVAFISQERPRGVGSAHLFRVALGEGPGEVWQAPR